jgi:hypothetical protein
MSTQGDWRIGIRSCLPSLAGWLAFALTFWLLGRAERNLYFGLVIGRLCEVLGVVRYPDSATTVLVVAWCEFLFITANACLVGRVAWHCVHAQSIRLRIRLALAAIAATGVLLWFTASENASEGRCQAGLLLLVVFVLSNAYASWAFRSHAKPATGPEDPEPRRPLARLSPGTLLFVAAAPCLVGGAVPYLLDWRRERAAALAQERVVPSPFTQLPVLPPLTLRLLGEHDAWAVLWAPGPPDPKELTRLRSLFPEAVVIGQSRISELPEEAEPDLPE